MLGSVLVLAAHPDDDVLGCGGSIAKYASEGFRIHVAFLADGVNSRGNSAPALNAELDVRRSAARAALEVLGVKSVSFNNFPDNRMDTVALIDIAQVIEQMIIEHKPSIVFTHNFNDVNIDHRKVHDATVVACRPQPGHTVKTILCYEVASITEWQLPGSHLSFTPNWHIDISEFLKLKLQALKEYELELRAWPHSRSIKAVEHLAHWRGATVGVDAAEAFMLGRNIA